MRKDEITSLPFTSGAAQAGSGLFWRIIVLVRRVKSVLFSGLQPVGESAWWASVCWIGLVVCPQLERGVFERVGVVPLGVWVPTSPTHLVLELAIVHP